jgi:hypothetical protein
MELKTKFKQNCKQNSSNKIEFVLNGIENMIHQMWAARA